MGERGDRLDRKTEGGGGGRSSRKWRPWVRHVDRGHGREWRQQGKCEGTKKGRQMEAEALGSQSLPPLPASRWMEGQREQVMHSSRRTTLPHSQPTPSISPDETSPLSGVFLTPQDFCDVYGLAYLVTQKARLLISELGFEPGYLPP